MESLKIHNGMSDNAKLYCLATMPELAENVMDDIIKHRCYKGTSGRNFKATLRPFWAFIKNEGIRNLNDMLLDYRVHLGHNVEVTAETKNHRLFSAVRLIKHLQSKQLLSNGILTEIKSFGYKNEHKNRALSDTEMNRLQDFLSSLPQTPQNARLKAMFALLIFQGLRTSEIIGLEVNDINFTDNTAMVLRKGYDQKQSTVLLAIVLRNIREHLDVNRIKTGHIFPSKARWIKGSKKLTPQGFRKIVKQALSEVDITNCPMGFRHYFATTLIKNNMPLPDVMHEMNHKNLGSTQRYYDAYDAKRVGQVRERVFSDVSF